MDGVWGSAPASSRWFLSPLAEPHELRERFGGRRVPLLAGSPGTPGDMGVPGWKKQELVAQPELREAMSKRVSHVAQHRAPEDAPGAERRERLLNLSAS